jgi:hypothetical protein
LVWASFVLTRKYSTQLERLLRNKHFSVFDLIVSVEEKVLKHCLQIDVCHTHKLKDLALQISTGKRAKPAAAK